MRKPKTIGEWIYPMKDTCGFDLVIWVAGEDELPLWEGNIMDFPFRYADLELDYTKSDDCDSPIDFRNNIKKSGHNPKPGFVIIVKER